MDDSARLVRMTREEANALTKDLPPLEDAIARWKREADQAAQRRAAAKAERQREEREHTAALLNAAVLERMEQRIAESQAALTQGTGEILVEHVAEQVAKVRAEMRRELDDFKRELKAEFAEQLGELRGELRGCLAAMK